MSLNEDDIREILRLIDESDLAELRIETEGLSLHVLRGEPWEAEALPAVDERADGAAAELVAVTASMVADDTVARSAFSAARNFSVASRKASRTEGGASLDVGTGGASTTGVLTTGGAVGTAADGECTGVPAAVPSRAASEARPSDSSRILRRLSSSSTGAADARAIESPRALSASVTARHSAAVSCAGACWFSTGRASLLGFPSWRSDEGTPLRLPWDRLTAASA
jgi:hypothetical protein